MAISLLNNIAALEAQNQLTSTQSKLQNTLFQLSSGSRINSGADDAAGLAIANGLEANITALTQSSANATSGVGLEKIEGASAYRVLLGEGNLLEKIKPTAYENLSLIPSEVDLCAADLEMARMENHLQRVTQTLWAHL